MSDLATVGSGNNPLTIDDIVNVKFGIGLITTPDRSTFDGEFRGSVDGTSKAFNGTGKYINKTDNTVYEGKISCVLYINGHYCPYDMGRIQYKQYYMGELDFPDGTTYSGGFDMNQYHGYGEYSKILNGANVLTYKGNFRYGQYHGNDIITKAGVPPFSGKFHCGMIFQHGILYDANLYPKLKIIPTD